MCHYIKPKLMKFLMFKINLELGYFQESGLGEATHFSSQQTFQCLPPLVWYQIGSMPGRLQLSWCQIGFECISVIIGSFDIIFFATCREMNKV